MISVLTPSFNSGKYLERAIKSVRDQDFTDWEHIVADGGSQDGTVEILHKYSHINWISGQDRGQSDAMNKAFAMATGDIIVYLNADDYFEPGAFREVIKTFRKYPKADMVVGGLRKKAGGKEIYYKAVTDYRKIILPFRYQFPANAVCYFYKRRMQEAVGPFPVEEHLAMDYWFLLRAFRRFKVVKVDRVLGTFYMGGENKTAAAGSMKETYRVLNDWLTKHDRLGWVFFKVLYGLYKMKWRMKGRGVNE